MRSMVQIIGLAGMLIASPAIAEKSKPSPIGEGVTLAPMLDMRMRYEMVQQDDIGLVADALTIRLRPGLELAFDEGLSILAEAEATLGVINGFNSTTNGKGGRYSVVADPQNIELNRIQLNYRTGDGSQFTVGRQRINLDDQRFVGSVGWRQNEQTFDAVRIQTKLFTLLDLDAVYANSQRTIFGIDAAGRQALDGDFYLAGAGINKGGIGIKGFAYLLDYDQKEGLNANSSQTYGVRATSKWQISPDIKFDLAASYAVQSDYGENILDYSADYISFSVGTAIAGIEVTGGYEELGAGDNPAIAFRTPLATLHKFNGWADIFLTTPPDGLRDYHLTIAKKLSGFKMLPGLNASVTYHEFEADRGGLTYGSEWDAQLGFKLNPVAVQIKYANYNAKTFSTDTEKLWLQVGYSF